MRDNRDELDRLLDSALGAYGDPGSDSGLERRILGRIASEAGPARGRGWLKWAIAAPVAAGLLLFVIFAGMRHVRVPSSIAPQTSNVQKPPALDSELAKRGAIGSDSEGKLTSGPKGRIHLGQDLARINPCPFKKAGCIAPTDQSSPEITISSRSSRRRAFAAKPAPLPKLEMFPTPRPLSPQEEALVNFAANAPKTERESLLAAQQQADAPLSIAAIEIKPLEPPASGAN